MLYPTSLLSGYYLRSVLTMIRRMIRSDQQDWGGRERQAFLEAPPYEVRIGQKSTELSVLIHTFWNQPTSMYVVMDFSVFGYLPIYTISKPLRPPVFPSYFLFHIFVLRSSGKSHKCIISTNRNFRFIAANVGMHFHP